MSKVINKTDPIQFIVPDTITMDVQMFLGWPIQQDGEGYFLTIQTPEGEKRVNEGEWIVECEGGNFKVAEAE